MKGKDILKGLTDDASLGSKAPSGRPTRPSKRSNLGGSGVVGAMKSELNQIAEEAAAAKALRETIAREGQIVDIDPTMIDEATIRDRIAVRNDPEFEQLKSAIEKASQQVPILVRPKPGDSGRYQAAYGHRRTRVAKELGRKVKAIVRELTDHEMVLAQGQENGPRQDLSFVERALYAHRLLDSGYDRTLICHVLGVDLPEVSRLLSVSEGIDQDLILAIGPAPKVGRPRWVDLSKAIGNVKLSKKIQNLISSDEFVREDDSNKRFGLVLKAANSEIKIKKPEREALLGDGGKRLAWFKKTNKGATISAENEEFSEFLRERLPSLISEFTEKHKDDS